MIVAPSVPDNVFARQFIEIFFGVLTFGLRQTIRRQSAFLL
jgi:hypothetical protein